MKKGRPGAVHDSILQSSTIPPPSSYLLYAYARICSIQRKVGYATAQELASKISADQLSVSQKEERDLLLEVLRFPDVIENILKDLLIHQLCEYIYRLSGLFTSFYTKCKVVGAPEQNSRLLLTELTRRTMERCLNLLGCGTLERI